MLPTRVERYGRALQFGVDVVAERIDAERGALLTAMARREVVLHQVNERDEGVRRWIADRTWPSEGTTFAEELRRDYQSWCDRFGRAENTPNSLTWSLERAGYVRRPWTQKPKARWRQHVGVRLRPPGAPRAADRTELLDFEQRIAGTHPLLHEALLRREVVAVPAFGMAAGVHHGVDLFIDEVCVTGSGHASKTQDLHDAYARWCATRAVASVPRRYFAEILADLGFRCAIGRAASIPPRLRAHARASGRGYSEIRLGLAMAFDKGDDQGGLATPCLSQNVGPVPQTTARP